MRDKARKMKELGYPYSAIGEFLGVSRQRAHQLATNADLMERERQKKIAQLERELYEMTLERELDCV